MASDKGSSPSRLTAGTGPNLPGTMESRPAAHSGLCATIALTNAPSTSTERTQGSSTSSRRSGLLRRKMTSAATSVPACSRNTFPGRRTQAASSALRAISLRTRPPRLSIRKRDATTATTPPGRTASSDRRTK